MRTYPVRSLGFSDGSDESLVGVVAEKKYNDAMMRREKSDMSMVPQGVGNNAITAKKQGGKAHTVKQTATQLKLLPETAESLRGGFSEMEQDESCSASGGLRKSGGKKESGLPALTMEAVAEVKNLEEACKRIAANRGAPGPDGQSIEDVKRNLKTLLPGLSQALLEGKYIPGEVRRVWIPKAGGGKRGLGIPNVVDRVVQQAVLQILQPHYDPTFHGSSHGFRPGRSCHTAITEAKEIVGNGYEWVVDIDLEKFFDTVNHQRLLARLERKVKDKRILMLIKRMLKAKVVMPDGVIVRTEEGTPQGGPLSPLLSNIVLSELDEELSRRGHKFVRYADDCNIYVRSERAGKRVLEGVSRYLEKKLRLKVNREKSTVARPAERHFLGFRLTHNPETGGVEVKLSQKAKQQMAAKIRELTPRTWGQSLKDCMKEINCYLRGWIEFYSICTQERNTFKALDAHIRRRLRAILLRQWKSKRTRVRKLCQQGVSRKAAQWAVYGRKRGIWALSWHRVIHQALRDAYFLTRGLLSLVIEWHRRRTVRACQIFMDIEL